MMTAEERKEYFKKLQDKYPKVEGVDYGDRWEKGIDHHPKSEALMKRIKNVDWTWFNGASDWQTGGDGDNGEILMYLLDIIFDEDDRKNEV